MLKETIELPEAIVEVEDHDAFLFLRERGRLRDIGDVEKYTRELARIKALTGRRRAVVDAREERDESTSEIREAMWKWLCDPTQGFEMVAFVLSSEMAVARVNMTALSRGVDVRAFDTLFAAQRWLVRGKRRSTAANMLAARRESTAPPPSSDRPSGASSRPPRSTPSGSNPPGSNPPGSNPPGSGYHITHPRAERAGSRRPSPTPRREVPPPSRRPSEPQRRATISDVCPKGDEVDDDSEGVA